ncbi:M50 family metallopeptidase [Oceanobacillus alkalisoli]|uniref:M50 family metallopeptidase n=1 Tax=Oceanobacillus alkalisoli TaxID=2925113 RepID=UPI001EF12CCD|nr:M50 family metallopeptidase [Oceanobacillus alkalisoli]MCF3941885.1 M50 family metallopeptidase [Oceanobacillus alkalisoli]MCG5104260.1 M50 family metallopeptidase [Oceanobacillus alkalisoli]
MMVRNLLPPLHIHPILILFIGISLLTGTFMEMTIIFAIVFVHEMGHYLAAKFFRWRIKRVMLWVFGGVMETDEHSNRPVKEELIVTLAGPLQHIPIYAALEVLLSVGAISESLFQTALWYNTVILLFNLLPIWPLDGGKILFYFLSVILPFRKALDGIFLLSLSLCASLAFGYIFFYPFTLTYTAIMIFLFLENRLEWKRRFYVFLRFLMRRYRGNEDVKKIEPLYLTGNSTLMDVFSQFKRERRHLIILRGTDSSVKRIDETDCLHAYFHKKQYGKRMDDLF